MQPTMPASSSRILYDVPCGVCMDNSSGKHYGVFACDGCAGFFKRSVRRERSYHCKARATGSCIIDKTHRNQCRSCRLAKCLQAGMNKDAVQHERGPRNSTIRRQMALFSKDLMPSQEVGHQINMSPAITEPTAIYNLPPPFTVFPNPLSYFNGLNIFNPPFVGPPFVPQFMMRSMMLHGDDPEKQCEVAARLLFLNVKWTKSVIPFESLSLPDRILLMEESWAELFVLGVAQFMYPIDLNVIFDRGWTRIDRKQVKTFESVLLEIAKLSPDAEEYMFLQTMVLFKTNFNTGAAVEGGQPAHVQKRLQDLPAVAEVQSRIQTALNIHTAAKYGEFSRPSQLHRLLSLLKKVSGRTIIELFFRNTIGDITVERIITDMYKSGRIPEIPFNF